MKLLRHDLHTLSGAYVLDAVDSTAERDRYEHHLHRCQTCAGEVRELREVTTSGLNFLLNRCYDSLLPVEREFPINVVWRASVTLPPQGHPVAAG